MVNIPNGALLLGGGDTAARAGVVRASVGVRIFAICWGMRGTQEPVTNGERELLGRG